MGNERLDDQAYDKGNKRDKNENLFEQNYLLIKVTEKQIMVIQKMTMEDYEHLSCRTYNYVYDFDINILS